MVSHKYFGGKQREKSAGLGGPSLLRRCLCRDIKEWVIEAWQRHLTSLCFYPSLFQRHSISICTLQMYIISRSHTERFRNTTINGVRPALREPMVQWGRGAASKRMQLSAVCPVSMSPRGWRSPHVDIWPRQVDSKCQECLREQSRQKSLSPQNSTLLKAISTSVSVFISISVSLSVFIALSSIYL